jgi:hypothetical protein
MQNTMEKDRDLELDAPAAAAAGDGADNHLINASGHRQELDRNFHLINICGLGITSGNTWIAIGGSIVRELSFSQIWPGKGISPCPALLTPGINRS